VIANHPASKPNGSKNLPVGVIGFFIYTSLLRTTKRSIINSIPAVSTVKIQNKCSRPSREFFDLSERDLYSRTLTAIILVSFLPALIDTLLNGVGFLALSPLRFICK